MHIQVRNNIREDIAKLKTNNCFTFIVVKTIAKKFTKLILIAQLKFTGTTPVFSSNQENNKKNYTNTLLLWQNTSNSAERIKIISKKIDYRVDK